MVKKIIQIFQKEISGLHEAAYLLGIFAILSQILALVRDKLLAYYFGAGQFIDLYYASFRIPDLIYVSIASMVSASVLVPFLIDKVNKDENEAKKFISSIFSVFFGSMIIVSIIAFIFVPEILPILLPGFANNPNLPELINASRILLLSPIFLGLSNFLSSITQIYNRFALYALSPILYNIGIIFGIIFLSKKIGLYGLVSGVAIGALLHLLVQIPYILRTKLAPRLTSDIDWSSIKKVILVSLPRTLTLSANQLSTFFLVAIASLMAKGSISIFNFSFNLQSVPLTIIGVSYSSAAFPTLAKLFSNGEREKYLKHMINAARHIIFWSMPITVLFIVLRAQIVRVVYGAGNFDWSDTRLTAASCALFIISAIGQGLILLFVRACYSEGSTRKPLIINIISSASIVLFGYALVKLFYSWPVFAYFMESLFKIEGQNGSVVIVLALAYSLGTILNAVWLWILFGRQFKDFTKPVLKTFLQTFSSAVIMGYVSYLGLRIFEPVFSTNTVWGIFMQGFASGILGIIVCIMILYILKNKEIIEIGNVLKNKIWKTSIVAPEQDSL